MCGVFLCLQEEQEDPDALMTTSMMVSQRLGGDPKIKSVFLELRITNQQMHLHPSIEIATQELFSQLAAWENIILNLPRIQHSRYQVDYISDDTSPPSPCLLNWDPLHGSLPRNYIRCQVIGLLCFNVAQEQD